MTNIAILGCGPAGLLAAEAVSVSGHTPVILSRKVPSAIFGAQFLHREIPGITAVEPDFTIDVIKSGTEQGYAFNTYGRSDAPVSWGAYSEDRPMVGWDLKKAYATLWDKFRNDIFHTEIDAQVIAHLSENYPIMYSTVPMDRICRRHHEFKAQKIWVWHGPGDNLIEGVNDGNYLYYNGLTPQGSDYPMDMFGPPWYRFSQLNQYQAWEYSSPPASGAFPPGDQQLSEGIKPLSNNCDCYSDLRRVGRFGRWEKGQLTHHAYEQVLEDLRDAN